MFVVPAVTPETIPDIAPTVATDVVPLLHTPPEVASDKLVVAPEHTLLAPEIAAGNGFTVTIVVAVQPLPLSE
jgi:hypothetical protein